MNQEAATAEIPLTELNTVLSLKTVFNPRKLTKDHYLDKLVLWLRGFYVRKYATGCLQRMAQTFQYSRQRSVLSLGIPSLLPFSKAVCLTKKSWQARHTGTKIVPQISIMLDCVLPHLQIMSIRSQLDRTGRWTAKSQDNDCFSFCCIGWSWCTIRYGIVWFLQFAMPRYSKASS